MAELRGGQPCRFLKDGAEIALIGEAQAVGYFGDAEVGVRQQLFCFFYLAVVDVFARSHAGGLLQLVVERCAPHGHFVLQKVVVEVGVVDVVVNHFVQAGDEAQPFFLLALVLGDQQFVLVRHALLQQPYSAGEEHNEYEQTKANEPRSLPDGGLDVDVEQLHGLAPIVVGVAIGQQGIVAGIQVAQFYASRGALDFPRFVSLKGVVEEVLAEGHTFVNNHFEVDGRVLVRHYQLPVRQYVAGDVLAVQVDAEQVYGGGIVIHYFDVLIDDRQPLCPAHVDILAKRPVSFQNWRID